MDLTNFTKKKEKKKTEVLIENEEVCITKINDNEIEFSFETEESLNKYKNFLFLSTTEAIVTDDDNEAEQFFQRSIEEGVEGLMFKSLNSRYKPGTRTGSMAKVKESKEDLDVVIVGAEHGTGKRAGFYSSFYVAVKDEDEDEVFLEIGKVSSGIKEIGELGATLENISNMLNPLKISEEKGITKFEPKIVIQVKYQEIQKSSAYNSGFALRFPRIVDLRSDKNIDEINSISDIIKFSK